MLLRVTPGVEAHTHEYVLTGQDDSKFGFGLATGAAAAGGRAARGVPRRRARRRPRPHRQPTSSLLPSFAKARRGAGRRSFNRLGLPELSIGGGLGVAYVEGEEAPTIAEWGGAVRQRLRRRPASPPGVTAEPGRAIVAAAAVTLYTVGTIKDLPGIRTYVAVDGGMSDNPRPVLYGSGYEAFLPRATDGRPAPARSTVVGKHCESGDVLVRDARVPADLAVGDILATPVTGAYGHSMGVELQQGRRARRWCSSRDGEARLVVRRETLDDLLATDVG